jgi:hypothetical protein
MPTVITGTDGINQVQAGAVESGDLASGAIGSGDLPAGSVIQVVYENSTTETNVSTSTYVDFVTATITPQFSSSKILVFVTFASVGKTNQNAEGEFRLIRDGSEIANIDGVAPYTNNTNRNAVGSVSGQLLDSPSTTAFITYKAQARETSGSGVFKINWEGGLTSLTLMEIAG